MRGTKWNSEAAGRRDDEGLNLVDLKYLASTVQSNGALGGRRVHLVQARWNVWRKVSGVMKE